MPFWTPPFPLRCRWRLQSEKSRPFRDFHKPPSHLFSITRVVPQAFFEVQRMTVFYGISLLLNEMQIGLPSFLRAHGAWRI